ncbi:MAG: C10 family peptidase [Limisphaerales bacterium]
MKITAQVSIARLGCTFAAILLLMLLSASSELATAAPVTSKQAAAVVTGWLSMDPAPLGETLGGSVQRVDTFNDQAGNPVYYVVYLEPSGLVIVPADDLVEPIVGFASAGQYDPSASTPLGALVSDDLSARVAYAQQAGSASPDTNALLAQTKWQQLDPEDGGPVIKPMGLTSVSDVRIAPLTQTTWDQQTAAAAGTAACYNYYTPPYGAGNTTNYPAGCVATAMAQLMRYYQFPNTGVGTAGFTIYSDGSPLTYYLRGSDSAGGPYVWSNMPLVPPASPTTTQCQAIGALLADAGATVNMAYTADGSSSALTDAKTALTSTFHFGSAIKGYNNGSDIGAGLVGMINPNLDARYPVLLGIEGSSGGHAVVADGYGYSASTLYHHLNLGWSGVSTAWYSLPLIDTSLYTFNVIDGCVYNAYTNGTGEIISGRVLDQIGRPVVTASVTATRAGGGTYTTTTDTQGIYALARIPSASSYSVTITKANYSSASTNLSTGTSSDMASTSGDMWGTDLTMNMLTTVIDHLMWGAVALTQALNLPFGVTITAQNVTNGPATDFTGPVALSAYASGLGSTSTVIGSLSPDAWLYGSEMTQGYAFTPSTNVLVTTVRCYNSDKVSIWTDSGTFLVSQTTSLTTNWVETPLATPITLSAGTAYRVSAHIPANTPGYFLTASWPNNFANGTVGQNFYYSYGDVFPTTVYGINQGPLVDLRYSVTFSNSITVSPTSSGAFVGGVWNGNITVSQAATNVVLEANDGAGHVAFSTPFNLTTPILLLSPQRPAAGPFTCTISSQRGQHLEILASTNLSNWTTLATLTNSAGTANFTDSAAGFSKRFYRANQLP